MSKVRVSSTSSIEVKYSWGYLEKQESNRKIKGYLSVRQKRPARDEIKRIIKVRHDCLSSTD